MAVASEFHDIGEAAEQSSTASYKVIRLDNNFILPGDVNAIPKQFVTLTQRLFLSPGSGHPLVVAFTGADLAAGSRVMCGNVARLLALQTGMSVCLIDVDDRPLDVTRSINPSVPGLAEALMQPGRVRGVARHVSGSLWALSSTRPGEETLRLLTAVRFGELIATIRSEFQYALFACPPIISEPASIPMCAAADTTVLVIGSKSTRAAAKESKRLLNCMGIQVAGAVLEQSRP